MASNKLRLDNHNDIIEQLISQVAGLPAVEDLTVELEEQNRVITKLEAKVDELGAVDVTPQVAENTDLIAQILAELEGKAIPSVPSGGGSSAGLTPEMFGCSKMTTDTFVLSSNNPLGSYTINHSLGIKPLVVFIFANSTPNENLIFYLGAAFRRGLSFKDYADDNNMYMDKIYMHISYWLADEGYTCPEVGTAVAEGVATENTILFETLNDFDLNTFSYGKGIEYTVITMA